MLPRKMGYQHAGFFRRRQIDLRNLVSDVFGVARRRTIRAYGWEFLRRDPRMTREMRRGLEFQFYEAEEIHLISTHLVPGDRVLELGVGMGVTSLVIAGIVGAENLRLYEIDPGNAALAERNFALNGVPLRCRLAAVVSGENAPATLEFTSNIDPLRSSAADIRLAGVLSTFSVETCQFETVCKEFSATALVIDIEGSEYDLIMRATDFGGVAKIILEVHPDFIGQEKVDALLARLNREGFNVVDRIKNGTVLALLRGPTDHPDP